MAFDCSHGLPAGSITVSAGPSQVNMTVQQLNSILNPARQITPQVSNRGFRPSSNIEIAQGGPPAKFDNLSDDSVQCKISKSNFNAANAVAFQTFSQSGLGAATTAVMLKTQLDTSMIQIQKHCK